MAKRNNILDSVRRSRKFAEKYAEPTIGDLNEPVSLAVVETVPGDGTSLKRNVSPYANPWALIEESSRRIVSGGDEDNRASHRFTIRFDMDFTVERGHVIVWQGHVYRVLSTKPVGTRNTFTRIEAAIVATVEDYKWNIPPDDEQSKPEPQPEGDGGFPLWS